MTIRRFAKRNLIWATIFWLFVCAVCAAVLVPNWSDAANLFSAARLNEALALTDHPPVNFSFGGIGALTAGLPYDAAEEATYQNPHKYAQSRMYYFKITPDSIADIGAAGNAAQAVDASGDGTALDGYAPPPDEYVLFRLQNMSIIALVKNGADLSGNAAFTGVLTPFTPSAISDISAEYGSYSVNSIGSVFPYMFDTTQSYFSNRFLGFLFVLVMAALIVLILFRLIRQYADKKYRPVYKQLALFNADEAELDAQLADCAMDGKRYATKQWLFTPGLLSTKVEKIYSDRKEMQEWSHSRRG